MFVYAPKTVDALSPVIVLLRSVDVRQWLVLALLPVGVLSPGPVVVPSPALALFPVLPGGSFDVSCHLLQSICNERLWHYVRSMTGSLHSVGSNR